MTDAPGLPRLMTVEEVAAALRTSRASVYWQAENGRLPGVVKLGRRLLFDAEALAGHLDSCRVTCPSPGADLPQLRMVASARTRRAPHRKEGEA